MTAGTATGTLRSCAELQPISLEELVDRASLLTRVDRKYLVPLPTAGQVVAELAGEARVLEIGAQRDFGYESLYYDTPELSSFLRAAHGRRRRFKVRRRTYLDSGQSYLEVKTRGSRGSTVKEREPLDGVQHDDLSAASRTFVDDVLTRCGLVGVSSGDLRPTLRTHYRRTTLYLPSTDSRVTLDADLAWSLPGGERLALPGIAVVETKSSSATSVADRMLWRYGCRPRRISKYGTGLAALREELPGNRWHPVLSRHIRAAAFVGAPEAISATTTTSALVDPPYDRSGSSPR